MKCHYFEVRDAEKYGVPKAILLQHLKFHMDSNQRDEHYIYAGKVWCFAKLESLEKMYPYFTKSSISRWLIELEEDAVIQSRKPGKNKGNHLKYYTVIGYTPGNSRNRKSHNSSELGNKGINNAIAADERISQSGRSNSPNGKTRGSQNGKSFIVNNNIFNRERTPKKIVDRVRECSTIEALYNIYAEYRRQKNRHSSQFEEEATKHQLEEWGLEKSKRIVNEAIRNGWLSLNESYLDKADNEEFETEGRPNAAAYIFD